MIKNLIIYWDFHKQPSLAYAEIGLRKRIRRVYSNCDKICPVDVRGQKRMGKFEIILREQWVR